MRLAMRQYFKFLGIIIILATISVSCRHPAVTVQYKPDDISPLVVEIPLLVPQDSTDSVFVGLRNFRTVYQFYKNNQFNVVWLNDASVSRLDSMVTFIQTIRYHGLLPQDYHVVEVSRLRNSFERNLMYRRDVLLTDAFLSIAGDLKYGRLSSLNEPLNKDSLNLLLLKDVQAGESVKKIMESQEPRHIQYQELKRSLKVIIDSADSINNNALIAGFTYDWSSIHKNAQCIEVNLERWRLELASPGDRYIWVNIPAYQLQVVENGKFALESKIIVGKPDTPTPTFSSTVECITFYPYWNVPRKIAVEEFLPRMKTDTSFLLSNNFEVLDRRGRVLNPDTLNWISYNKNNFPFTLRQREGKENSLGLIKFVFDNPYAVYLHDTNAKGLFRNKKRAFSHGCVRIEKARELAIYLIPTPGRIDKILESKSRQTINVANPIPIYIRYFTCESVNGALNFYDDIYGKDRTIISYLYGRNL